MAEKDKIEKKLEDYNDVFADILNVLLFKEDYIKPELLIDGPTESIYKADNAELRNQFRDTLKYYGNTGIVIADLGIENQSTIDGDIPIRVMGYDYAAYRSQIDKGNKRYPVITVVLNFSDTRWNKPKNLKGILDIPEGMEKYISDYKIHIFDIAFLENETIKKFKSTFKHVAHFFKNKRKLENYKPLDEEIEHVEAFLDLIRVFTGDNVYDKIKENLIERQKKGQVITMSEIFDYYWNNGVKEGLKEGLREKEKQVILNMHKNNCTAEDISRLTGIEINIVNEVLNAEVSMV